MMSDWGNIVYLFIVFALILNFNVNPTESQGEEDQDYECDRYCHINCDSIPANHKEEIERCKRVHSNDSGCHCHFGGHYIGLFVALGLAAVLIMSCCICRHCKTEKRNEGTAPTTNIVVVTQPETVTTITHQGSPINFHSNQTQNQQQHVYSIEMVPQKPEKEQNHYSPPPLEKVKVLEDEKITPNDDTGVMVITSRRLNAGTDNPVYRRSPSSERVHFYDINLDNEQVDADERIFTPPRSPRY